MRKVFVACVLSAVYSVAFTGVACANIPSVGYVDAIVRSLNAAIDDKADDSAVVHLTGAESIGGVKTFTDGVHMASAEMASAPADDADDNSVPTTGWVNAKVQDAKGYIPVGSADATVYTRIWIEE